MKTYICKDGKYEETDKWIYDEDCVKYVFRNRVKLVEAAVDAATDGKLGVRNQNERYPERPLELSIKWIGLGGITPEGAVEFADTLKSLSRIVTGINFLKVIPTRPKSNLKDSYTNYTSMAPNDVEDELVERLAENINIGTQDSLDQVVAFVYGGAFRVYKEESK